ncbi:MAG: hypothetical protein E7652_07195 [Ruminococcaceae bacterium]|nr:hypothetical protein [Oscillospiraceae bacterium]
MKFDELYRKYKDNTATDEERAYVEAEIAKAKGISEILNADKPADQEKTVKFSDVDIIKKAKKKLNSRNTLKTVIIVCLCVAVIGVLVAGGLYAAVFLSANKSKNLSRKEAVEVAKNCLAEHERIANVGDIRVGEVDEDIETRNNPFNSFYIYEVDLTYDGYSYEVVVNGNTGYASISGDHYRWDNDDHYDDDDRYDGVEYDKNRVTDVNADSKTHSNRYDDDYYDDLYDDDRYEDGYDDDRYDDRCPVCYNDEAKRVDTCKDCCIDGYCLDICPFE